MTSRVQKLEQKLAQLQAQLDQAKAVERAKERKRRTRQSIIGFTTLQACLENGIEIHLKTPEDLIRFLQQNVRGTSNRKTWGFDGSLSENANDNRPTSKKQTAKKTAPKKAKSEKPVAKKEGAKGTEKKVLREGADQNELIKEFNL
ncbi:MAG: hypothetical protein F6J97_13375 [Leptolyngbya sp. SIO4C1]|nr:hypothetical protein [Leptolyngbya sp. SIO4C1]